MILYYIALGLCAVVLCLTIYALWIYNNGTDNIFSRGPENYFYNNVLYRAAHGINFYNTDADGSIVKNNVIDSITTSLVIVVAGVTGLVCDYNSYFSDTGTKFSWSGTDYNFTDWKTNSSVDASSITTDPLFTNVGTFDFSLQAGSPCINTGTSVGLTRDYLGNPIVGNPDIGAYEKQP